MPTEYDPAQEFFDAKECPVAMREAVEKLADDSGQPMDSFNGRSFAEIGALAEEVYDELPSFWQVWKDWHTPRPQPDMGDL